MRVFLLLIFGCEAGVIDLDDPVDAPAADTGSAGDSALEDSAPAEPDFSVWDGNRRFYYDYSESGYECDETVTETGATLHAGDPEWDSLAALCPACDLFYEVTPAASSACGGLYLVPGWRGVELNGGGASVRLYYAQNDRPVEYAADEAARLEPSANLDSELLTYRYSYYYYGSIEVEVTGTVTYPLTAR